MPVDLCEKEPRLKDYGFYRKLNTGKFEFISFCNPVAIQMIGIHSVDFENVLNALLPKKKP